MKNIYFYFCGSKLDGGVTRLVSNEDHTILEESEYDSTLLLLDVNKW